MCVCVCVYTNDKRTMDGMLKARNAGWLRPIHFSIFHYFFSVFSSSKYIFKFDAHSMCVAYIIFEFNCFVRCLKINKHISFNHDYYSGIYFVCLFIWLSLIQINVKCANERAHSHMQAYAYASDFARSRIIHMST